MRPLILDYQIHRIDSASSAMVPYNYDPKLGLNVITNSTHPLIEAASTIMDDGTSTRKAREQDDYDSQALLGTDTKLARENSDHFFNLLELKTKTLTNREADDERPTYN